MTASVVVRICSPFRSRRWLTFGSGLLVALYALLSGARPAYAQTTYHVDDDVDDGLIAYYKLEETFEGDAIAWDIIGGAHGTTLGGANFVNTQLPPIEGQNLGKLDMPDINSAQILINTTLIPFDNEFTVAAWIKRGQTNKFQTVFDAGTGELNEHWYVAIGDNTKNNSIVFGRRGIAELIGTTAIADTNWHHITVSHAADDTLTMYLDGSPINTFSDVTLATLSGAQRIGAVSIDDDPVIAGNFDGAIDELRFYDRVLLPGEIQRLADGFGCVFDGESWTKAFPDLQCALEVGGINDTIRVAKGRYLPGIHPDAHFALVSGDNIQGGFNGNEAPGGSRPAINLDPANQATFLNSNQYTILTGDLRGDDPPDAFTDPNTLADEEEDNLQRIFLNTGGAVGASLDGVVVTGARSASSGGGGRVQGSLTLANSIFLLNRAAFGGGLTVGFNASAQLNNVRFVHNEAEVFGGGIETESFIDIANTRFISNTAGDSGGGLDVREEGVSLNNVDFEKNVATIGGGLYVSPNITSFSYTEGELAENEAESGGAIYTEAAATLNDLTVRANIVITKGAGIYSESPLTINNSRFLSNIQTFIIFGFSIGGGGIFGRSSITLTNSLFQGNRAHAGGGLMVEENSAPGIIHISDVTFRDNGATADNGGGIYMRATGGRLLAELTDVIFEDNFTDDDEGGALSAVGGVDNPVEFIARRITVRNNVASQHGGGLSFEGNVAIDIADSAVEGNQAESQGGGIFISSPTTNTKLTNVTIRDNHALTNLGGGLYFCCASASLEVENVLVEQNSSAGDGGGMNVCCSGGISGEHLTLDENTSATNGGGLALCCSSEISSLQHVTITANSAISNGGGIYLSGGAQLTVTNGLLTNNRADRLGGGVYAEAGSDFSLSEGRLQGNSAQTSGGGIFVSIASIRLTDVQVIRNTSTSSGGGGVSLNSSFDNVLRRVDFIENSINDDDGGAMRIRSSDAIMDRVSFQGNAADQSGGAIALENDADATITNAIFVGNAGNRQGDASDNSNAIFVQNNSRLRIINSSIAANSGDGVSLLHLEDSGVLTLTNVILWDNAPQELDIEGTSTLVEQNVITGNPTTGVDPLFSRNPSPGDGNWRTFNDNDYGDLQLRFGSPAIDQGNGALLPAGISQDFGGNARIFDVAAVANAFASPVDLGAFEVRFVAPTANAGGPYSGNEAAPVALDGSDSSDDGTVATYAWDCTNDNSVDITSASPTGSACTYPDQGEFTVRLRVTDDEGISAESTVAVTIENLPPDAQDDSATTLEDTPITIDVLANDSDVAADPLTISEVGTPTSGSALIEAGKVRYTPATDFNGSASFSYTVSDGDGGSANATVTLTVTPVEDPDPEPEDETIHLPLLGKE